MINYAIEIFAWNETKSAQGVLQYKNFGLDSAIYRQKHTIFTIPYMYTICTGHLSVFAAVTISSLIEVNTSVSYNLACSTLSHL